MVAGDPEYVRLARRRLSCNQTDAPGSIVRSGLRTTNRDDAPLVIPDSDRTSVTCDADGKADFATVDDLGNSSLSEATLPRKRRRDMAHVDLEPNGRQALRQVLEG